MEPDHSGAVRDVIARYPEVKIVGNAKTFPMVEAFFGINKIPMFDQTVVFNWSNTSFMTPSGSFIYNKLTNPHVLLGFSSLMAGLMFIGGMIMIMLGLLGEYIGRIYISINSSPQFVVREVVKNKEE